MGTQKVNLDQIGSLSFCLFSLIFFVCLFVLNRVSLCSPG